MRFLVVSLPLLLFAPPLRAQCIADVLEPPDPAAADWFGYDVDLSGTVAVVGAPFDDDLGPNSGSVHVFTQQALDDWPWTAKLTASDGTGGARLGTSVDVEGGRLVAGAPGGAGAVYVYDWDGTTWVESAKLVSPAPANGDLFGQAVSLTTDAVIVGAPGVAQPGADAGRAYVFELVAGSWTLAATLAAPAPAAGDELGFSVAIDDGLGLLTAVVGAPGAPNPTGGVGRAFSYDAPAGAWGFVAEMPWDGPQLFAPQRHGHAVDLDGGRAVVSDPFTWLFPNAPTGNVAFYTRTGTGWTDAHVAYVAAFASEWGNDVAVEGTEILAGYGSGSGAELHTLPNYAAPESLDNPASAAQPGASLGRDGDFVLLGARGDGTNGNAAGRAYLHYLPFLQPPQKYCVAKASSLGCLPNIFGLGTPTVGGTQPFEVGCNTVVPNKNGLLFYGLTGKAALPFFGGTLCVLPPLRRTPVQTATGPGPACADGSFSFDMAAWIAGGNDPALAVPGTVANAQYWYRDPAHPDGTGVGLSGGLEFLVCF